MTHIERRNPSYFATADDHNFDGGRMRVLINVMVLSLT